MSVSNVKASVESEKLTLKIISDSENFPLFIGCHFPPKSTNFGLDWHTEIWCFPCTGGVGAAMSAASDGPHQEENDQN